MYVFLICFTIQYSTHYLIVYIDFTVVILAAEMSTLSTSGVPIRINLPCATLPAEWASLLASLARNRWMRKVLIPESRYHTKLKSKILHRPKEGHSFCRGANIMRILTSITPTVILSIHIRIQTMFTDYKNT